MHSAGRVNHFRTTNNDTYARSPIGRTYIEHDDKNLKDMYNMRRDVSADTMKNRNHFFSNSDTPYLNGKKNQVFDNPSLRSSNIFYEHNYGYVNDFPNERLLTPVKHDRFRNASNDPHLVSNDNRPPLTPPKAIRIENEEHRGSHRGSHLEPRRLQEQYDREEKKPRRGSELENNQNGLRRGSRRESALSQPPSVRGQGREETAHHNHHHAESHHHADEGRAHSRRSSRNEPLGLGRHGQDDDNRSVRSGTTIVSHLSCTDYMCPKCLNSRAAQNQRAQSVMERRRDKEMQDKVLKRNAEMTAYENARDARARQERVHVANDQKDEINYKYNERLENRRSPSRVVGDQGFKQIFDKQDDYHYQTKVNGLVYRDDLKDQIRDDELNKKYQREVDQRPGSASLNLTEDYYFKKYNEDKSHVLHVLQDQVEYKKRREENEREFDKIETIHRNEEVRIKGEEEDRRVWEKNYRQKKELQSSFWKSQDEKHAKQKDDKMRKTTEKFMVDSGYNEFKKREHENQVKIRQQYRDFLSSALGSQEKPSYKKLYEERKMHKEATSFDPKKRPKKVYPCGECNYLFEKVHLTKMA